MHQTASQRSVVDDENRIDHAILTLLLNEHSQPWAGEELVREIGDAIEVTDSIRRLHAAGLVHRLDQFVFVSRGARRTAALLE